LRQGSAFAKKRKKEAYLKAGGKVFWPNRALGKPPCQKSDSFIKQIRQATKWVFTKRAGNGGVFGV